MEEKNTIELLERQSQLVERLKQANMDEMVDIIEELSAMNSLVKSHITLLKRFIGAVNNEKVAYNKSETKYEKV